MNNNNDFVFIKAKINSNLSDAFKKALLKLNISTQEFIERQVTEFVVNNLNLILEKDTKGSSTEK